MKRFNNIWWVGGFLVYVVDQGGGGLRCGWVQLVWAAKQHNTEKPQPTFAAAVDILPYYAKTPVPLSLSLSLSSSLWERILSLWGFSQRLQFFLFFPARRIHKNSLKRQLVNEIYYCHRYAFLSFCYVFPGSRGKKREKPMKEWKKVVICKAPAADK